MSMSTLRRSGVFLMDMFIPYPRALSGVAGSFAHQVAARGREAYWVRVNKQEEVSC